MQSPNFLEPIPMSARIEGIPEKGPFVTSPKTTLAAACILGLTLATSACSASLDLPNTNTTTATSTVSATSPTKSTTSTTPTKSTTSSSPTKSGTGTPAPTSGGYIMGKGYKYKVPSGYTVQENTGSDDTYVRDDKTSSEIYTVVFDDVPADLTDACVARDRIKQSYEEKGMTVGTDVAPVTLGGVKSCALRFTKPDSKTGTEMSSIEHYVVRNGKIYSYILWGTVDHEKTRISVSVTTAGTWVWS